MLQGDLEKYHCRSALHWQDENRRGCVREAVVKEDRSMFQLAKQSVSPSLRGRIVPLLFIVLLGKSSLDRSVSSGGMM